MDQISSKLDEAEADKLAALQDLLNRLDEVVQSGKLNGLVPRGSILILRSSISKEHSML